MQGWLAQQIRLPASVGVEELKEKAMKMRSSFAAAAIGGMCLLVLGFTAEAAELRVLSAVGMQSVMEDLGPKFERADTSW